MLIHKETDAKNKINLTEKEIIYAPVAFLNPGDSFGELALLNRSLRQARITAVTPTNLGVLWGDDFEKCLSRFEK